MLLMLSNLPVLSNDTAGQFRPHGLRLNFITLLVGELSQAHCVVRFPEKVPHVPGNKASRFFGEWRARSRMPRRIAAPWVPDESLSPLSYAKRGVIDHCSALQSGAYCGRPVRALDSSIMSRATSSLKPAACINVLIAFSSARFSGESV
jgi:hypothetical protein